MKEVFLSKSGIIEAINNDKDGKVKEIIKESLIKKLKPEAKIIIEKYKQENSLIYICSASTNLLVQPLGDYLGIQTISTENLFMS